MQFVRYSYETSACPSLVQLQSTVFFVPVVIAISHSTHTRQSHIIYYECYDNYLKLFVLWTLAAVLLWGAFLVPFKCNFTLSKFFSIVNGESWFLLCSGIILVVPVHSRVYSQTAVFAPVLRIRLRICVCMRVFVFVTRIVVWEAFRGILLLFSNFSSSVLYCSQYCIAAVCSCIKNCRSLLFICWLFFFSYLFYLFVFGLVGVVVSSGTLRDCFAPMEVRDNDGTDGCYCSGNIQEK